MNVFTGTSADDTFASGVVDGQTPANSTLQAPDELDGGAGTLDRLSYTIQGSTQMTDATNGALIKNIETINVRDIGSGGVSTFNAGLAAGVTAINSDRSTQAFAITNLSSGASAGMIGNGTTTNGALTFGYKAATATVAGATAATFNATNGTTAGAVNLALATGATVAALTVNSTGAANTIGALNLASSGTANVTGLTINAATNFTTSGITNFKAGQTSTITAAGAATTVSIGTLENTVKTVDGSGLTLGGITTTLVTGNSSSFTFVGGQGNDKVTTAAVANTTAGSVNAGAGTADILVVAADSHVDTAAEANVYTGFEVLEVGTGVSVTDASLLSTISALRLSGTAGASKINATTAANVTVTADGTYTIAPLTASTPGQIDTVGITAKHATANTALTLTTPVLASVENLILTADNGTGLVTVSALTSAASLTNLTVKGASDVSVTTGAVAEPANLGFTFDSSQSTASTITFNASAATANGIKFIGGTSADTVTGTTTIDNISAGAGNNVIKALGGNDVIAVSAGTNTIAGGVGTDSITLGTGSDTVVLRGDSSTITDVGATAQAGATGVLTAGTSGGAAGTLTMSMTINDIAVTTGAFLVNGVNAAAQMQFLEDAINNNAELAQYVTASGTTTLILTATTKGVAYTASGVTLTLGGDTAAAALASDFANTVANVRGTGVTTVDTITGFDFGTSAAAGIVDKFLIEDGSATAISIYTGSDTALVGSGDLTGALNSAITKLALNQAGIFTYDGASYLVIDRIANSSTFGETTAMDVAVKLVGHTGTLDASDFIFA